MTGPVTVVKTHTRRREPEAFDPAKLHESIRLACLTVRSAEGSAESAAKATVAAVLSWLGTRREVTSADIRRVAARTLQIHNPDAAYYYTRHKHVL